MRDSIPLTPVESAVDDSGWTWNANKDQKSLTTVSTTAFQDNVVFSGGEKGIVRGWDYRVPDEILTLDSAHTRRIKGLAVSLGDNGPMPAMIASASSDGSIKVWDPRMLGANGGPPVPMRTADTKARLTCLAMGGYGGGELLRSEEVWLHMNVVPYLLRGMHCSREGCIVKTCVGFTAARKSCN